MSLDENVSGRTFRRRKCHEMNISLDEVSENEISEDEILVDLIFVDEISMDEFSVDPYTLLQRGWAARRLPHDYLPPSQTFCWRCYGSLLNKCDRITK